MSGNIFQDKKFSRLGAVIRGDPLVGESSGVGIRG